MTTTTTRRGRRPKYTGCSVTDCENSHYAKTYCRTHWSRYNKYGDPQWTPTLQRDLTCEIEGCDKHSITKNMCKGHYSLWWYYNTEPGSFNPDHHNVKETVSYQGAHYRIRRTRGHARDYKCVDCDKQARDWSLRAGTENVLYGAAHGSQGTNKSAYSVNPMDYEPRCGDCHKRYDAETGNRSYKTGQYALINQNEGTAS